MDMKTLARVHQESCRALADRPLEELLLWYADLGLEVHEAREEVAYHCPRCGTRIPMALGLFLLLDSNADLRCAECGGDPADRGGEG
ncbi:MAG: hypothetical protein HY686_03290 [Chloroflexi bacterium]|nr:hypothetical protein [Chloroflexota bacterium]